MTVARGLASRLRLKLIGFIAVEYSIPGRQGIGFASAIETHVAHRGLHQHRGRRGIGFASAIETCISKLQSRISSCSRQGIGFASAIETCSGLSTQPYLYWSP